jgi:aspartyl-tRNA synthetase
VDHFLISIVLTTLLLKILMSCYEIPNNIERQEKMASTILGYRSTTLLMKELVNKFKIGDSVVLSGWVSFTRRQKDVTFIGLKDSFGMIQLVVPSASVATASSSKLEFDQVKLHDVITVRGVLNRKLGPGNNHSSSSSGVNELVEEYECLVDHLQVENHARHPLPLAPSTSGLTQASNSMEQTPQQRDASLKHRYLDLRLRPGLARNLKIRNTTAFAMRDYMINQCGFLEVETPTLFKSTPEGAREFLVPVSASKRHNELQHSIKADGEEATASSNSTLTIAEKPRFYALVQSPQQYKQLLMVGGLDRYFQFARCYRDEGGRADRQPEFTQLDMEMSFVKQCGEVEGVIEGVVCAGWNAAFKSFQETVPPPPSMDFPRMSLSEAMRNYGSDKPNLTFGMKIESSDDDHNPSIRAPHLWSALSRKEKDELRKYLYQEQLVDTIRNEGDDYVVFSKEVKKLGRARLILAQAMKRKSIPLPPGLLKEHSPIWINDFGLFEADDETPNRLASVHHPFTAPHPDDIPKLSQILQEIKDSPSENGKMIARQKLIFGLRGLHYDLVCDGVELGGGSIRVHSASLQRRIFRDALGLSEHDVEAKFGHLLEALELGAPPHGGFALGFDRFMSMLCKTTSLSDTLAFPKSSTGTDPMTGAPCTLTTEEEVSVLARYNLRPL